MNRTTAVLAFVFLLATAPAFAQRVQGNNGPGEAIPVRCVNVLGTAFESCGGGGGAGTDVNITGVGGNAVGTTIPVSGTVTVTDGAGSLNVIVDSGTITTITNAVTVTDGAGALNTIVDSGTITTITNPVTVTDGAGALNVIVDSGTITAVTTITNPVTVTDGAGALNVIVDSVPANASTDVTRFGGNAVATGVGAGGAGIPRVTVSIDAMTYNAPTAASVGVANAQALASNASRKGLIIVNTSSATISCSVGQTAVLNSGISLQPGAAWTMPPTMMGTGALNCIASLAASNLSIQELQ